MNQFPHGDDHPQRGSGTVDRAGSNGQPSAGTAKEIWEWVKSIAVSLVIVLLLNVFVFNLSTVKGQSMEPTLKEKEWLFVNKLVYLMGSPARGDVVILKDPEQNTSRREFLVKRVVAVPGDRVEIRGGKLYVNGAEVQEPYTDNRIEDGDRGPFTVEEDRYYVLGDNRHKSASKDSRMFGSVSSGMIKGRADFILWPFDQLGTL
ncbi:signal peptidase I [Paenibacillus koleovorans]|uniref:signal peptidase I n=1 Tax=Paenibacillus koleovorans TaxID=121608 RepID=UPI000FDBA75D|nr:signal peptidase I [Paenibacillus koleovorans]